MDEPAVTFKHTDDFRATYANSVRFESTVYDLTIIFGQTDQETGREVVKQHTSVTIPWSLVKLAEYYLEANLLIHQTNNGKVVVPPGQIPPPPPEPDKAVRSNPNALAAFELVKKLREKFVANL